MSEPMRGSSRAEVRVPAVKAAIRKP